MKSPHLLVATLFLAIALAGCGREESETAAQAAPARTENESDVPGVVADEATQQGLGIELAPVTSASVEAQSHGTATVIDSSAFATSIAELASLRAEAAVAADNEQRLEKLYEDDGNASRQSVVAARQQISSLRAKLAGAESRARLDWGSRLAQASDAPSVQLRADVVSGAVLLFRAEFPNALGAASELRYELLSSRGSPIVLQYLDRSRAVAQFAVGDSVLLALRTQSMPDAAFRPNERVPVVATASGAARPLVPPAAAIAYQGRMWCYVARPENRFDRVVLSDPAIKAGDRVVVRGATLLLSLERSAGAETGESAEE
jgi:hypothetical protein